MLAANLFPPWPQKETRCLKCLRIHKLSLATKRERTVYGTTHLMHILVLQKVRHHRVLLQAFIVLQPTHCSVTMVVICVCVCVYVYVFVHVCCVYCGCLCVCVCVHACVCVVCVCLCVCVFVLCVCV